MEKWKENKAVGIVAGLVVLVSVILIIKMFVGQKTVTPEQKAEIVAIDKIVNAQMNAKVREPQGPRR